MGKWSDLSLFWTHNVNAFYRDGTFAFSTRHRGIASATTEFEAALSRADIGTIQLTDRKGAMRRERVFTQAMSYERFKGSGNGD